ncbi:MAG TPA: helitron helicase-like domain-containing protein, partial [Ferruginibacter sp.]|nr:helitron helicase-like domain-containing protein [Ferruginibacter sp.]
MMYYDKRFQIDPHFPLIAFNHEQIKECTTAGYLLAEKSSFENISKRLLNIDQDILNNLTKRLEDGERVKTETDEEKLCFQLIKDLDHVGGHVKDSATSKKYMRNEIWSLISFIGAPSWFITFAPADNKHPICLYYADTQEKFSPLLKDNNERYRLIANNPVAGARFFHFICKMFIKHVLGVDSDHDGVFGPTNAYYGTVEQQGRLTLHLHLLLWIKGAFSPQEIRDTIMDPKSDFQQKIVEYLESVHVGEFLTGTKEEVEEKLKAEKEKNKDYQDPTQTLPELPPPLCKNGDCASCCNCENISWWDKFKNVVDDLILRSNVHNCRGNKGDEKTAKKDRPSCINKHGNCKSRFPRTLYEQTQVDPKTGALNIKKGEAWINTLTPVITYLLRCNTDVTSLMSGTAIKAIVAYISDYITKPGLKTYVIFDAIKSVFNRNSEILGGTMKTKEKARRILTKTVNALTSKMEIGGPMASLYLLGNPDHYASHKFVTVYWKNYVREVFRSWKSEEDLQELIPEKLVVQKGVEGEIVGFSTVDDYMYRPKLLESKTLY